MEKETQEEKVIAIPISVGGSIRPKGLYYLLDASERKKIPKPIREYLEEISEDRIKLAALPAFKTKDEVYYDELGLGE